MTDRFKKAGLPGLFHDTTMAFLAELLDGLRAPGRGISIVAYSEHWDVVFGISNGGKPGIVPEVLFHELDGRAFPCPLLNDVGPGSSRKVSHPVEFRIYQHAPDFFFC